MVLFGRKSEVLNISGAQLCELLEKAVLLAKEDVEAHCYTTGPEIIFEYNDTLHFCGIKYDKKRHWKEKRKNFSSELMTLYVDEQHFDTVNDLCGTAVINRRLLSELDGIVVAPEYKELLAL